MQRRRLTPAEIRAFRELARAARELRDAQEDAERHRHQRDDSEKAGTHGTGQATAAEGGPPPRHLALEGREP